jgi:hypothetical protein
VAWSRRGFLVGTLQVRGARGRSLQNLRPSLPHQAVMEIWGIPFCEACAREQEAYFDIGKLHDAAARVSVRPRASQAYCRSG